MQRVLKDKLSRNWFSQRELQKWNSLTIEEVKAGKTSGFKAQYDKKDALRKRVVENGVNCTILDQTMVGVITKNMYILYSK